MAQISPATLPDLKLSTSSTVFDLAVQDDGKLIISGDFVFVNDVPRTNIARLNRNGTVDLTWHPAINGQVYAIVPSESGIYLGGLFEVLDDTNRFGLVRVSAFDGATDKNWGPRGRDFGIRTIAVSGSDVYVAGVFTSLDGLPRGNIAKLSATGTGAVDLNWNPNANAPVGKIVVKSNDVFASGFSRALEVKAAGISPNFRPAARARPIRFGMRSWSLIARIRPPVAR